MIRFYFMAGLVTVLLGVTSLGADMTSETVKGELWSLETPSKLLFNFERTVTDADQKQKSLVTYTEVTNQQSAEKSTGSPAVIAEYFYDQGGPSGWEHLSRILEHQKQKGEEGELVINGSTLKFSYTKNGKKETSEETLKGPLVSGDQLIHTMWAHWTELLKGESVAFRFPVLDRRETVGFEFSYKGEAIRQNRAVVRIEMKAASFFVRLAVKPIDFYLEKEGLHRPLEVEGLVQPKFLKNSSWQDLVALTRFHQP